MNSKMRLLLANPALPCPALHCTAPTDDDRPQSLDEIHVRLPSRPRVAIHQLILNAPPMLLRVRCLQPTELNTEK